MNPQLHWYLSLASFFVAAAALLVSLLSAFPILRTLLAVVRDGVLWLALFFVIGGAGFVVWQRIQSPSATSASSGLRMDDLARSEPHFKGH